MLSLWSKKAAGSNSSPYEKEQVIFESAVAGTYEVELLAKGNYEVYCIGGGGGAIFRLGRSTSTKYYCNAGGSGAGFIGVLKLTKNIYSITVGAGGNGRTAAGGENYATSYGGGDSIISEVVTCGGGIKCTAEKYDYGKGGSAPTIIVPIISQTLNVAGNNATKAATLGSSAKGTGGASVYNGYGKGGNCSKNNPQKGTAGYVKIVWKG